MAAKKEDYISLSQLERIVERLKNYFMGAINLPEYQKRNDDELDTKDKSVVGAINENREHFNTYGLVPTYTVTDGNVMNISFTENDLYNIYVRGDNALKYIVPYIKKGITTNHDPIKTVRIFYVDSSTGENKLICQNTVLDLKADYFYVSVTLSSSGFYSLIVTVPLDGEYTVDNIGNNSPGVTVTKTKELEILTKGDYTVSYDSITKPDSIINKLYLEEALDTKQDKMVRFTLRTPEDAIDFHMMTPAIHKLYNLQGSTLEVKVCTFGTSNPQYIAYGIRNNEIFPIELIKNSRGEYVHDISRSMHNGIILFTDDDTIQSLL